MTASFYLSIWYLAILLPAPALYGVLRRFDLEAGLAWTASRMISLVVAAMAAWISSHLGMSSWTTTGVTLLAVGAVLSARRLRLDASHAGRIGHAELVFAAAFAAIIVLRLQVPEIRGTEKPVDFGILNTLLATASFPPADFWFAGETLNYYYFGLMPWIIPLRMTGIPPEYAYNLVVASVGAAIFSLAWAIAVQLGASRRVALLAGFLCTFSGTLDGLRQLAVSRGFDALDPWSSSRQVIGAITEYPLFTTWLGDLHAHFTSAPIFLAVVLLALVAFEPGRRLHGLPLVAACCAAAVMANTWLAPALAASVAALALAGSRAGGRSLVVTAALAATTLGGALLLTYPFAANIEPPAYPLELARTQTRTTELFLYAGVILVPLAAALYRVAAQRAGGGLRPVTLLWLGTAAAVVAAVLAGRPVLVLLVALGALAARNALTCRDDGLRAALWLAVLGLGLFAAPEVVVVRDDYGESYRRMNTVFKAYVQGWTLVSLALPVLLQRTFESIAARRAIFAGLLAVSIPHLIATSAAGRGQMPGLDGLRWMDTGDRAIVSYLRARRLQGIMLESPGRSYSDAGRIAAATGTAAYLGWREHQRFWRGEHAADEIARRSATADDLYSSGDVDEIRRLAAEANIALVVIGSVERGRYQTDALRAIESAGSVVLSAGEARVVQF